MAHETSTAPIGNALERELRRMARRMWFWKGSRACAVGLGGWFVLLLISAVLSGPSLSRLSAGLVWATLLCGGVALFVLSLGDTRSLRGAARARLLETFDPRLASRVRSAVELVRTPNGSPELVISMATAAQAELAALTPEAVVPKPPTWSRTTWGSLLLAALCLAALAHDERALSGLYALTHPGSLDEGGVPIGAWVASIDAVITPPDYLHLPVQRLTDPRQLTIPAGSRLELRVRPKYAVPRASLGLGDRTLPLRSGEHGTFVLTLVPDHGGQLLLRARVGESWLSDRTARKLIVTPDAAPLVTLDSPRDDRTVDANEPVPFTFRVKDDHGLSQIDLVVQFPDGRERRTNIAGFAKDGELQHSGTQQITLGELGAEPGDALRTWVEARDRDLARGPNVGRSVVRTLTVSAISNPRGAPVALLTEARDQTLDMLGHRLESPLAEEPKAAAARTEALLGEQRRLGRTLESLADAYASSTGNTDAASTIRDMERRLSRLGREEREASASEQAARWKKSDGALINELEDDALLLTDLIGRARLADAEHVISQLEATRARMRALIDELKSSSDPARRAELMQEINRARNELRELRERLAQAEGEVPNDFVNYEALRSKANQHPLDAMQEALERGDMEAAEKALADLESQLDGLMSGLTSGEQAFASARMSPRQQALRAARGEVEQLKRAQQGLANETARMSQAQDGSNAAFQQAADGLAQRADELERRTRELEARRSQPAVAEAQASATQRLRDAADALRRGDAAEAQNMSRRAAADLEAVENELSMDARMYPGPDGSRAKTAREAKNLSRDARAWASEVEQAMPEGGKELADPEREALKQRAPAQDQLSDEAGRVANELGDDTISDLKPALERAQRAMQRAAQEMGKGHARGAESGQREALDRLSELSERLRAEEKALGGRSGKGGEEQDSGQLGSDEKVTIPEAGEDPRRNDLRRRVLDARRAETPEGFRDAVERYYQEILR